MGDVLILGCGPSGLLAAHAVERLGGSPHIMSVKVKSRFQGAQYLHEAIPDLTGDPHGVIRTYQHGTREGYAEKVYGDPSAPCSWGDQLPEREAWDLRAVYNELWSHYQSRILDTEITRRDLAAFEADPRWPLVISTIPATKLCAPVWRRGMESLDHHEFSWDMMYTVDYAPPEVADNTVLYSGSPEHSWYRSSRVFGHGSTEFGSHEIRRQSEKVEYSRGADCGTRLYVPEKGIKVMGTTCNCFPGIKRAGRFGTWRKGYLTHHAFADATRYYQEAFG